MIVADLMPSLEMAFSSYGVHAYIRNGWASNVVNLDGKEERKKESFSVHNYLIFPLMAGSH